ncbi:hypothetical protein TFLX_05621 [Thermoflexales bacterium]|nr:hypothetical protein TFLX_05621 [Thermoflexales bacterium]
MKGQKSLVTRPLVLTVALTVLFLTAVTGTQAAPVANQITVRDQNLETGIAVVDSVTAARSGWVVIYKEPDFTAENLVGYAPVREGTNLGVKVVVSLPKIDHAPMLWAVLQGDAGQPGIFEWGLKERAYADGPIAQNGQVVVTQFATAAAAPLPVTTATPRASTSRKTVSADRITVHDQDVRSGFILVDAITTTQPGWVVFYKNPNFTPGEIVGFAPVYSGVNTNVKATIDTPKLGKSTHVWAQLHKDDGQRGVFEWERQEKPLRDWPLVQDQRYVRASFSTSAARVPTSTVDLKTAQIAVNDQALDRGIIVMDAITTPLNGWIVIYKDPNLTALEIVGYAPVYKGTNHAVKVNIETAKVGEQAALWAVLHSDGGLQQIFEWGYKTQQFSDPPMFQKGQYVSTRFGTTGGQLGVKTGQPSGVK